MDVNEEQPLKAYSPMLIRPAGSSMDVIEVSPRKTHAGTTASPVRSANAANSTSIGAGATPSPSMHARTSVIGHLGGWPIGYINDGITSFSLATSTSKPPSPVTPARLGSPHAASAASAKRRPASRLPERSSVVTSTRMLVRSDRPNRAHSRAHRTRRARARHALLTPLSARSVGTSANAKAS